MDSDIIKVLFIDLTPFYGGGQKFLKIISQQIDKGIHSFYIVSNKKIYDEIESTHKFLVQEGLFAQLRFINDLLTIEQINITFLNGNRPIYFAPFLKCSYKIAYKHTSNNALAGVRKVFGVLALHICYFFCNRIILLYSKAANDVLLFKKKVLIINNGIKITKISSPKTQNDKIRFICVTRLDGNKGLEWLISAFYRTFSELSDHVELLIVGDGPLRAKIEDIVNRKNIQNIILTGFREDVDQMLLAADIFIFPSKFESFPLSILEAMKCNLPIIATDTGGVSEMVINGENGYLIKYLDNNTIEKAMIELYENKSLREYYGNNSGRFVADKFSLTSSIEKMESIIYELHSRIV